MKKSWLGGILLILAAAIWGSAFVAQRNGMDYSGPLTFNATRCCIGALILLPVAGFLKTGRQTERRSTLRGGIFCGLALFFATNLQQLGLVDTGAGKAGFITTFYIVLVPVLGTLRGRRCGNQVWISVALALTGLYFLCMKRGESVHLQTGDLLLLICALFYAIQIMVVDHFVENANGVMLSCIQFAVCGVLSMATAFLFETPDFKTLFHGWIPLLYTGILSCGVAYTLQIIGQRYLQSSVASLFMSLESAFAVLSGWLILNENLSGRELLGCALVFSAVILVQLWPEKKAKRRSIL